MSSPVGACSGGRSRCTAHPAPVARARLSRRCRLGLTGCPVRPTPAPTSSSQLPGARRRADYPHPTRLHLARGPSVRCRVRTSLCTPCIPWSSGLFQVTGLSTGNGVRPQNFRACPPCVHSIVHTRPARSGGRGCCLVDVPEPGRHNLRHVVAAERTPRPHHHHSIAHVATSTCAHSRPPGRLFRFSGTVRCPARNPVPTRVPTPVPSTDRIDT